jgi:hypothetical protein
MPCSGGVREAFGASRLPLGVGMRLSNMMPRSGAEYKHGMEVCYFFKRKVMLGGVK